MNRKLLTHLTTFSFISFFILSLPATAQTWKWGKRGGAVEMGSSSLSDETVKYMATDPRGNVYILSDAYTIGLNIDGHPKSGFGYKDIVLSSFTCDGVYRWSKVFGTNSTDLAMGLGLDTLGGIYVGAYMAGSGGIHLDVDFTGPVSQKKNVLIKYDTAGVYQWHRQPQSDTIGIQSIVNTYFVSMDVDNEGNTYTYCQLAPGAYVNGALVVPVTGIYILKYDRTGTYISATHLDISFSSAGAQTVILKRDHGNGKYILTGAGAGGLTIGGTPITHSMFAACLSTAGNALWVKQDTVQPGYGAVWGRAVVDDQHRIYLGGKAPNNDLFNGYLVANAGTTAVPFVMCTDSNGAMIWAKNGTANATTSSYCLAMSGGEVVLAGQYPGKLKWAGFPDSLNHAPNVSYDVFFTRFNATTGAVLDMDSLKSANGASENVTSIAADKKGNYYIGGLFDLDLVVNGTTLQSVGGDCDFFVAKLGFNNCNCTAPPTANYTYTGAHNIAFTYTGTTSYDSLRWSFGDGGTATTPNPAHNYATAGSYNACVTVYTNCGSNTYCQNIVASYTRISSTIGFEDVRVYPNPATGLLNIENVKAGTSVKLLNILGQCIHTTNATTGKMSIDSSALPSGSYILQLSDKDGNRMAKQVVKN